MMHILFFFIYWTFFLFALFLSFNFLAELISRNPTNKIPANIKPGIMNLKDLGKNEKYFL